MFQWTPLRVAAAQFAEQAGYCNTEFKLRENKRASAYDVLIRIPGQQRGRCIGAILLRAVYP